MIFKYLFIGLFLWNGLVSRAGIEPATY